MGLIAALDHDFKATGKLFWDDGEALGKSLRCNGLSMEST